MVGWHHRLDGHGFEQAAGGSEGQGTLVCFSPRGRQESDTTEQPPPPEGQDAVGRPYPSLHGGCTLLQTSPRGLASDSRELQ